jgi:hypothetical protein
MSEFRMLNVTEGFGVIDVLGGEEALKEWAWVGKNGSRQALYNKLRDGGWDVHGNVYGDPPDPNRILVRRLG